MNVRTPGRLMLCVGLAAMFAGSAWAQTKEEQAEPRRQQTTQPAREGQIGAAPRDADEMSIPIEFITDVVYATTVTDAGTPMELTLDAAFPARAGDEPLPALIYIHGGTWSRNDKSQGRALIRGFAQGGYFAASIDYRTSDEAIYPAAIHDAKAAVRFIRKNAEELGVNPDRIGVIGHSTGAMMASLLGTSAGVSSMDGDVGETGVSTEVQAVVAMSGLISFRNYRVDDPDHEIARWLGGPIRTNKIIAKACNPAEYIDTQDPPFLLIHGSEDRMTPYGDSKRLEVQLVQGGGQATLLRLGGVGHELPSKEVLPNIAQFLDGTLGGHAAPYMDLLAERMPIIGEGNKIFYPEEPEAPEAPASQPDRN